MIKYLKKIAALTIAVVLLISSYSAVGITVSAATLENDDTDFIPDNYGEYISNDELGELVSYNGYIAKSEYARLLNDESVGAGYYSPTFEGCYDTGGNQIYVRRAMARQYVGEAALMIWVGGSRAYCIQPGEPLNSGSALEQTTDYGTWADLSRAQQQAINTALCYGREGNFAAIKGNTSINSDQCYIATQLIVREIVNGERSPYYPFSLTGNGYLSMYCADGYNGNIAEAYHRIEVAMGNYQNVPSFASRFPANIPSYTLNAVYNNVEKKWNYETLTLTDTNGVLSSNFSAFNNKTVNVGNATVTAKMNGNTLTLTPSNAKLNTPATTATMSTDKTGVPTTNEGKILAYASSYQDVVSGGSIDPPSAFFNVRVNVKESAKLNSDFRIRKAIGTQAEYDASEDDEIDGVVSTAENLEGWYFRVTVSNSSEFYQNYHVYSFTLGPTDKAGLTPTASSYVLENLDYSNVSFTVKTNGDVTAITMTDKQTEYHFSKVNEKGQRISGAELQILDSSNAVVVPTWTSSATEDYTVKGKLVVGKKYKLHEVKAPNGYSLADDIEFEVKDSLEPVTITMVDLVTGVYINKVNTSGELVENAHLRLTDSSGNVKDDWYSTKLPREIKGLTVGNSYTLTEVAPPKGYVTSKPVTFTVKSGVTLVKMIDYPTSFFFAKREPGSEAFVSGAHLQVLDSSGTVIEDWITGNGYHIVTGKLEIGKSYVLHEVEPPKGRAAADDITFTVEDKSGAQNIKMYDPKTTTYVSKFSVTGQEELAGALLSVTDSHNNVIAEWTSTNRRKVIYGLAIGEESV